MKKLLYLFLTVLIVACSDSDSPIVDDNTKIVDSWLKDVGDIDLGYDIIYRFNADGSGDVVSVYENETYLDPITWAIINTQLTIIFDNDQNQYENVYEYEFVSYNQLTLVPEEGGISIFNRIIE